MLKGGSGLFRWPGYLVILKWLQDQYQCEIVTFTADLGQGEEVEPARAKAEALGQGIYIDDLREEFVRDLSSRCSAPTPFMKASTCWHFHRPSADRQAPD